MTAATDSKIRGYLWLLAKVALAVTLAGLVVYRVWFVPMPVQRHTVGGGEIVVEVMGTGTLDAHVKATISTKIPGRLRQVLVDQGDTLIAQQEIARLDEQDLTHEVEVEEANVFAQSAAIERLQADVAQAKAVLIQAMANESRTRQLVSTNAVSRDELDKASELLGVAKAGVTRADAGLMEGKRRLVVAQRTLEFRRARLDDAIIRSPFDSVVIRRDRNVGDVVVPGSSIFAVVATNELWVNAWVDESAMASVRPKQAARVVFRSRPDQSIPGTVVRTARETDRETREFLVDVAPSKLPEDWSVGQRAEVYIETARKRADVIVPARYLIWNDLQPMVFVEVNNRAVQRPVTLGLRSRDTVEILDGLTVGEAVLKPTRDGIKLINGQRVQTP